MLPALDRMSLPGTYHLQKGYEKRPSLMLPEPNHEQKSLTFPLWGMRIQHTSAQLALQSLPVHLWAQKRHRPLDQLYRLRCSLGISLSWMRTAHLLNHTADAVTHINGKLPPPPALPSHKTLLQIEPRTQHHLWVPQQQGQKTEIHETANKITQKPCDAHAGSSDWNVKYRMYGLPYTRQRSLSSTWISCRGWEDCLRPLAGEDWETSSTQHSALSQKTDDEWDKQCEKTTVSRAVFPFSFLWLCCFFCFRCVSS